MWKRVRHRPLQGLVVALLAAVITGCVCFGPLYDRAMQQALASLTLDHATPGERSAVLSSSGSDAVSLESLLDRLPPAVLRRSEPPASTATVNVAERAPSGAALSGRLLSADGVCGHLLLAPGRCPAAAGEVAISTADARAVGWHLGSRIRVTETLPPSSGEDGGRTTAEVVGVYRVRPGDTWAGLPIVGRSGTVGGDGLSRTALSDDLVTDPATLAGPWVDPTHTVSATIEPNRVDVDGLATVGRAVSQARIAASAEAASTGTDVTLMSGLPELADTVAQGKDAARVIVPLLMVQLALLAVVVLWLVLGAATEQRRPEVALARLRGRRTSDAGRLLLGELGVLALVGVVAGGSVALASAAPVAGTVLGRVPFEVRTGFWVAWAGAAAVVLAVVLLAIRQVVREPVADLLRRVPPRRTGWRLGVADALLGGACAAAVVAFVVGGLTGPLAFAAPTLLALLVGLVLAHLVVPVASALGRSQLGRGRVATGVGMLHVARRPATRRVLALLTVATSLLVFSADALAIGARNRAAASEQINGAAAVTAVSDVDETRLLAVLHAVDPTGSQVTPVITVRPPGDQARTLTAVDPQGFAVVALLPESADGLWSRLAPPDVDPVRVTGSSMSLRVTTRIDQGPATQSDPEAPAPPDTPYEPVSASVDLLPADGRTVPVLLGDLPQSGAATLQARVPCADGCVVTGLRLGSPVGLDSSGALTVDRLSSPDGGPVDVGPSQVWESTTEPGSDADRPSEFDPARSSDADPTTLAADFSTAGAPEVSIAHEWAAPVVPALVTGTPKTDDASTFEAPGLDGLARSYEPVGSLPRVPGSVGDTTVADLGVLLRAGGLPDGGEQVQVWYADDDPQLRRRTEKALRDAGAAVATTRTLHDVRLTLDESTPAWSLALAVVAGGAGLVLAALVLVVVAVTTWRTRSRDLASLRMAGLDRRGVRRIAAGEQLPAVLLAGVAGAACGVVGAHLAMPTVPLFAIDPAVSTLDLHTAWPTVGAATLGSLAVLLLVAWLVGRTVARRATLDRVRQAL